MDPSLTEHLPIDTQASAVPYIHPVYNDVEGGRASLIAPYPSGIAGGHDGVSRRSPRPKESRITAGFAALASLVAIVMLIYVCKALLQSRVTGSSINQRKLSDKGDDSTSESLVICLDTDEEDEEDEVEFVSATPPTKPPEDAAGPSAKMAKLETGAKETKAAEFASPHSGKYRKKPAAKHQHGPSSSEEEQSDEQPSTSGKAEVQPGTATSEAIATPPSTDSPGPSRSPQEVAAVQGLLSFQGGLTEAPEDQQGGPQQQPERPVQQVGPSQAGMVIVTQHTSVIWSTQRVQQAAGPGTSLATSEAGPSAPSFPPSVHAAQQPAASGSPIYVSSPEVPGPASPQPEGPIYVSSPEGAGPASPEPEEGTMHAAPLEEAQTTASPSSAPTVPYAEAGPSGVSGGATSEQPSTSGASYPQPSPMRREHPFFRLPSQVPAVYESPFDPHRPGSHPSCNQTISFFMNGIADLLSKEKLNPRQLFQLAKHAEVLKYYLTHFQTGSVAEMHGYQAVRLLGFRFLALDLLVCALRVLGEKPEEEWWDRMVAKIPHAYQYYPVNPKKQPKRAFNQDLARDLSNAVATLKTGQRPDKETVIGIKRRLFCSELSPAVFKSPQWNPWRQADREAGGSDEDDDDDGDDNDDDA